MDGENLLKVVDEMDVEEIINVMMEMNAEVSNEVDFDDELKSIFGLFIFYHIDSIHNTREIYREYKKVQAINNEDDPNDPTDEPEDDNISRDEDLYGW